MCSLLIVRFGLQIPTVLITYDFINLNFPLLKNIGQKYFWYRKFSFMSLCTLQIVKSFLYLSLYDSNDTIENMIWHRSMKTIFSNRRQSKPDLRQMKLIWEREFSLMSTSIRARKIFASSSMFDLRNTGADETKIRMSLINARAKQRRKNWVMVMFYYYKREGL